LEVKNFITSYKFAKIADIVFSGVFLKTQIDSLKIKNYKIIQNLNNFVYIRNLNFEIRENDVIFCRTEDVKLLFSLISKLNFKNIRIITHQSDLDIDYKLYAKKPKCISQWYSVNINYKSNDLVSIPIGLANEHPKNLHENVFSAKKINKNLYFNKNKKHLLYLNFQQSTNLKSREGLNEVFNNYKWTNVEVPSCNKKNYTKNLQNTTFVLAPYGNGFDTHRVWEALYSGSIPVVEKHITYTYAEDLPMVFSENLFSLNESLLIEKKSELEKKEFNFKKLDFEYWNQLISEEPSINTHSQQIVNKGIRTFIFEINYLVKYKINSKKKKFLYYLRKLKNLKKSYLMVFKK